MKKFVFTVALAITALVLFTGDASACRRKKARACPAPVVTYAAPTHCCNGQSQYGTMGHTMPYYGSNVYTTPYYGSSVYSTPIDNNMNYGSSTYNNGYYGSVPNTTSNMPFRLFR